MDGFSTAFSEITLVLFTTLAPSGAVAYVLMSLPVLFGHVTDEVRQRLNHFSCIPLGITMVGLIASATHLGNPANALYVFTGVGRSPLSTEVLCAVVFLMLAGVYWLYSFAEQPRMGLQRVLLVAIDVAAFVFVVGVALAYHVDTIITWNLPLVPVSLAANAFLGGPVLALASWAAAGYVLPARRQRLLLVVSAAVLLVNTGVYVALGIQLDGMENELASVPQLVPAYGLHVALFAVLALAGLLVAARALCAYRKTSDDESLARLWRTRWLFAGASALVLAAIFIMRFTFYMTHLTLGLGV